MWCGSAIQTCSNDEKQVCVPASVFFLRLPSDDVASQWNPRICFWLSSSNGKLHKTVWRWATVDDITYWTPPSGHSSWESDFWATVTTEILVITRRRIKPAFLLFENLGLFCYCIGLHPAVLWGVIVFVLHAKREKPKNVRIKWWWCYFPGQG